MSLLDCQRSMVGLLCGSQEEYLSCKNLSKEEGEWLNQAINSPGLRVTRQTQQWWRTTRVHSTAPLTAALLKRLNMDDVIFDYIANEPVRTLFFAAELEQFTKYLQCHSQVDEQVKTLIEFEAAIKRAYQVSVTGAAKQKCGSSTKTTAQTLCFRRDPVKLFTALLTGAELPVESKNYYLLVGPDLPQFWCLAD